MKKDRRIMSSYFKTIVVLVSVLTLMPCIVLADSEQVAQYAVTNETQDKYTYTVTLSKDGNVFRQESVELNSGENFVIDVSRVLIPNPPNAPSNFTATDVTESQVDLVWVDNSLDETGFKVERDLGSGFVEIADLPSDTTSYSDTGLSQLTYFCYRARAYNDGGYSDYSNSVCVTTEGQLNSPRTIEFKELC